MNTNMHTMNTNMHTMNANMHTMNTKMQTEVFMYGHEVTWVNKN